MKQLRFIPGTSCGLRIRENEIKKENSRKVEGKPVIFGVRSSNLTPWSEEREVYEVLEPGCISKELLQRSDVILNLNHSDKVVDVLGRCRNGKGTLDLSLRGNCLEAACDLPNTRHANDTIELIRRGDINGMSFAYECDGDQVKYECINKRNARGKEEWIRHVNRISGLYDVSIVTHPAFLQTSVDVSEEE